MVLDVFERYKHNFYLSPVSPQMLEDLGERCGLSPDSVVLEAECGKGGVALTLAARFGCQVTGTDSRPEFVEEARLRAMTGDLTHLANFLRAGWNELPFDEGFFDLALSFGPPEPRDVLPLARALARVVRPQGWLALSELVWTPGPERTVTEGVRDWLERFPYPRIHTPEEAQARFESVGLRVENAALESDASWENFYAPQARVILENRREYSGSPESQATLDAWQGDLERYHTGGGKESLAYACFLLRVD